MQDAGARAALAEILLWLTDRANASGDEEAATVLLRKVANALDTETVSPVTAARMAKQRTGDG